MEMIQFLERLKRLLPQVLFASKSSKKDQAESYLESDSKMICFWRDIYHRFKEKIVKNSSHTTCKANLTLKILTAVTVSSNSRRIGKPAIQKSSTKLLTTSIQKLLVHNFFFSCSSLMFNFNNARRFYKC